MSGLLSHDNEPIKIVKGARRGEALGKTRARCGHEDGRGRCTSRETTNRWNADTRHVDTFCSKHYADFASVVSAGTETVSS